MQLEHFNKYLNIDGIIITKLDGTAKGGVALTAISEYNIPYTILELERAVMILFHLYLMII